MAEEDLGYLTVQLSIAMMAMTVSATGLRLFSRATAAAPGKYTSRFWWDDWLALMGTPLILTTLILVIPARHLGLGKHIDQVPTANLPLMAKLFYINHHVYIIGRGFAKASTLFLYSRVLVTAVSPRRFKIALYTIHILNIVWTVGVSTALVFICVPEANFSTFSQPGRCIPEETLFATLVVGNTFIDLAILILPLLIIYQLHLSTKQRTGLFCVSFLRCATVVVSIGRCVTTFSPAVEIRADPTYAGIPYFNWFIVDGPVSLTCISIPAVINLIRQICNSFVRPPPPPPLLTSSSQTTTPPSSISHTDDDDDDKTRLKCADEECMTVIKTCSLQ